MSSDAHSNSSRSSFFLQMDSSYRYGSTFNAMNELMRAIILRVIEDYNSGGELRADAIEYLNNPEEEYIFSFVAITRHLGLDPEKTKYQIMNTQKRISTRRRAA
jgi:hypothetical protein